MVRAERPHHLRVKGLLPSVRLGKLYGQAAKCRQRRRSPTPHKHSLLKQLGEVPLKTRHEAVNCAVQTSDTNATT